MSGDAHVWICESLGVKFPRATRLFVSINGKRIYLWRALDCQGEVLDILVQSRRNKKAALKLMRKLLKKQGFVRDAFVTDKLPTYGAALKDLGLSKYHDFGGRKNSRARRLKRLKLIRSRLSRSNFAHQQCAIERAALA